MKIHYCIRKADKDIHQRIIVLFIFEKQNNKYNISYWNTPLYLYSDHWDILNELIKFPWRALIYNNAGLSTFHRDIGKVMLTEKVTEFLEDKTLQQCYKVYDTIRY